MLVQFEPFRQYKANKHHRNNELRMNRIAPRIVKDLLFVDFLQIASILFLVGIEYFAYWGIKPISWQLRL